MPVQELQLFRLAPAASGRPDAFADPEWRGAQDDAGDERRLRPLADIRLQIARLAAWIAAGGAYGWLGAYQARRAAFELQSVRAQIIHESGGDDTRFADRDRRAVQSRLDRLQACLEAARADGPA
jgi:hypothetical protein